MTWTAPQVERHDPDLVADERRSLEQWVDFHRATLLMKCAGLTADQLKLRPVPPSRLSLLGLVRHMTEVERWWFRMHAAGEAGLVFPYDADAVGLDFDDTSSADAEQNLQAFVLECEAARAAVSGRSLEDTVPSRGDHRALTRRAVDIRAHDRGVRPAQRSRRPPPRGDRRRYR